MLEGRTFGIPPKREVKVDPYLGQSLLIMHPAPSSNEKGKTYRFELTKLAVEELKVNRENNLDIKLVSFSFGDEEILIANTTSMKGTIDSASQYNVSMDGNFSNKNAHDYISHKLGLDPTQENKFKLNLDPDHLNFSVATLELIVAKPIEIDDTNKQEAESTQTDSAVETNNSDEIIEETNTTTDNIENTDEIEAFENESPN